MDTKVPEGVPWIQSRMWSQALLAADRALLMPRIYMTHGISSNGGQHSHASCCKACTRAFCNSCMHALLCGANASHAAHCIYWRQNAEEAACPMPSYCSGVYAAVHKLQTAPASTSHIHPSTGLLRNHISAEMGRVSQCVHRRAWSALLWRTLMMAAPRC